MKPFWVYILRCADGSYYTGHTDDLDRRLTQHQHGECDGYTATRRPVALAWSQPCATREEALSAELQIKGWSRKKKEAMMRGDWQEVSRLAHGTSAHGTSARGTSAHASTSSARTDVPIPASIPPVDTYDQSANSSFVRQADSELRDRAHHNQNTQPVRPELVEGRDTGEENE